MNEIFHDIVLLTTKSFQIDHEAIEELRLVLEKEQNRQVSYKQAEEVGRGLITIMETLANGRRIVCPDKGKYIDG